MKNWYPTHDKTGNGISSFLGVFFPQKIDVGLEQKSCEKCSLGPAGNSNKSTILLFSC